MKSFTLFTMKSKQVWMKSKPYGFDEIKSVFISLRSKISSRSDFICGADLFRRKTDLVEKSTCRLQVLFFWVQGPDLNQRPPGYP